MMPLAIIFNSTQLQNKKKVTSLALPLFLPVVRRHRHTVKSAVAAEFQGLC